MASRRPRHPTCVRSSPWWSWRGWLAGNISATTRASTASFFGVAVPCRLMYSIVRGPAPGARQRLLDCQARTQAFRMRSRHMVRIAGLAVTQQLQVRTAALQQAQTPRPHRCSTRADPRQRAGRAGARAVPGQPNPYSTLLHSESTPPTTTASHSPRRISRSAWPKTLALEEQAVAMVKHRPSSAQGALHEVAERMRRMQLGLEQVPRDARRIVQMTIERLGRIDGGRGSPHHQRRCGVRHNAGGRRRPPPRSHRC